MRGGDKYWKKQSRFSRNMRVTRDCWAKMAPPTCTAWLFRKKISVCGRTKNCEEEGGLEGCKFEIYNQ